MALRTLKFNYRNDCYAVKIKKTLYTARVFVPVLTDYTRTPIPVDTIIDSMRAGLRDCVGKMFIDVEFCYDASANPEVMARTRSLYTAARGLSRAVESVEFATGRLFSSSSGTPDLILVLPCELDRALVGSARTRGYTRIRTNTPEIAQYAREIGMSVEDL